MARREYKAGRPTTLTGGGLAIGATDFTIASDTNWPTGADYPFWVTIDGGEPNEERILCLSRSGTSVTIVTTPSSGRGQDTTTESNHASGASVWPSWSATDADEANAHVNATTGVHGLGVGVAPAPIASPTFTGNVVLPSTTSIGNVNSTEISYVDGVTSAIQTQLNAKAPIANPTFTGTVSGVTKAMVGLGNVDNTTDAGKPISTATQTALNGKLSTSGGTVSGPLTVTGKLNVAGTIDLDSDTRINFSNDDYLAYDDTSNTYVFGSDNTGYGNISCGNIDNFYTNSVDVETLTLRSNYVELSDTYCRPRTDNDTNLGSPSRRWIRVFAVNTAISSSDERDKLDVVESPLGLDFINDLRPVAYRWKVGEKTPIVDGDGRLVLDENGNKTYEIREGVRKNYGLISQEVKQAVDNSGVDDFAGWVQDDMSDPDSHQSLSYEQFIAPLIKSVQELSAEVQTLKAKVAELEAK